MSHTDSSTFQAKLASLHAMLEWLRTQMEKSELPQSDLKRMEVALEEALVNIIRHAYKEKEGSIELTFTDYPRDHIEIRIKDHGPPFNPLENGQPPDSSLPLEQREVGGLGISLIKQIVDELSYMRKGEENVLILIKRF